MTHTAIPRIDAAALFAGDPAQIAEVRRGATEVGFLTLDSKAGARLVK